MVAQAVPIGSPMLSARDVLRDREAHCRWLVDDGVLRCTFGAFDTIQDHLQDVYWEIRAGSKGGKVAYLAVHRTSRTRRLIARTVRIDGKRSVTLDGHTFGPQKLTPDDR